MIDANKTIFFFWKAIVRFQFWLNLLLHEKFIIHGNIRTLCICIPFPYFVSYFKEYFTYRGVSRFINNNNLLSCSYPDFFLLESYTNLLYRLSILFYTNWTMCLKLKRCFRFVKVFWQHLTKCVKLHIFLLYIACLFL